LLSVLSVGLQRAGGVGLLPRKLEIATIDFHQTGYLGEGSDHLRLIKFWPSCAPGKGVCDGAKQFWLRVTTASAQCWRLSERFFHRICSSRL